MPGGNNIPETYTAIYRTNHKKQNNRQKQNIKTPQPEKPIKHPQNYRQKPKGKTANPIIET